jgi:hypothetical protein
MPPDVILYFIFIFGPEIPKNPAGIFAAQTDGGLRKSSGLYVSVSHCFVGAGSLFMSRTAPWQFVGMCNLLEQGR